MLIKIDLNNEQIHNIEQLVQIGAYDDLTQFLRIAITNQLQEEKSEISKNKILEKGTNSNTDIRTENQMKVHQFKKLFSTITFSDSQIKKYDNLIWSFYNRFFPIKIIINELAMMITPDKIWIDLDELKESALLMAQKYSKELRLYEIEEQILRNAKLSTGLPIHNSEINTVKFKRQKTKLQNKIISSKHRFSNQFIGKCNKNHDNMDGACFSMGLLLVKFSNNICFVSLTKLGKEFAMLENPILHLNQHTKAFSSLETEFIFQKIISKFKTEKIIIDQIINKFKDTDSLNSNDINEIFQDHYIEIFKFYYRNPNNLTPKQKMAALTQARIATMGRLSELGIVHWGITSHGISNYELNHKHEQIIFSKNYTYDENDK